MSKIFDDRSVTTLQAFTPGSIVITFSRLPSALVLAHSIQYQFSRSIGRFGSLTSPHMIVGGGYPSGSLVIGTMVTMAGDLERIVSLYGSVCSAGNYITVSSRDACTGKVGRIIFGDCVLDRISGAITADNHVVIMSIGFTFSQMWIDNV